jgi:YHS domain-containing protein
MRCDTCGKEITMSPIFRKLMWRERYFCSGQCAMEFDKRLLSETSLQVPQMQM